MVYESLARWLLGLLKNWEGEYAEATRLQSQAVQMAREHHVLHPLLSSLWSYGLILTGKGEYDDALEAFEEALTLSQKVGAEIREHRILNSLGWFYLEMGDLERSLDFNQQCVDKASQRGDAQTLNNAEINIGDVFLARGDLAMAQEVLEGVHRVVSDPATSDWEKWRYSMHLYASLGDLWLARHEPTKAKPFVEQCLAESRRTHSRKYIVKSLRQKGEIARHQNQWDEAEIWLRESVLLARSVGNPTQLWQTYLAMGHLYRVSQQPDRAQESYQAACDVIYRIKVRLKTAMLRESLEHSPVIQQVYDY